MRDYIFIILAATIFLFTSFTKSFSQENVFTIDNIEINESISLNFKASIPNKLNNGIEIFPLLKHEI